MNASSTDVAATFGFDYGIAALSIPEAPNTRAGDAPTTGVKAEANLAEAGADEFAIYPTGQNFTGNYQLRFDAWMNIDPRRLLQQRCRRNDRVHWWCTWVRQYQRQRRLGRGDRCYWRRWLGQRLARFR